METFAVLDGDGSVLTHFFHQPGDDLSDDLVSVGGNGGYILDLLLAGDFDGSLLQIGDDVFDRDVDSSSEVHRVQA